MKELAELISLVNRNKVKRIDVIGSGYSRESKYKELYDLIALGKVRTDQEAAELIYPDKDQKTAKKYYNRLKRKLTERVLNTMFFIDTSSSKFNNLQKAYYHCHKKFAEIKILLGRGGRKTAIKLSEQTIKKTITFEFTDLTVNLAKTLKSHYGQWELNRRLFNKYKSIQNAYQEIYNHEILVEDNYTELVLLSKRQPQKVATKAKQIVTKLAPIKDSVDSLRFIQFYYYILLIRYNAENNQEMVIQICEEIISKFKESKKYKPSNLIALYLNESLPIIIAKRNYIQGESIAKQSLSLLTLHSNNWFVTNQQLIILYLHAKEYQKASDLYSQTISVKRFSSLQDSFLEPWKIIEGFIHYLHHLGKIKPLPKSHREFRLSRFVNDVPKFSREKRGANITIIIIQVLFLLQQKKYAVIIDKIDSLKSYCHRHLRRNDTFRSNCFIKMLLVLPKSNFNKTAAKRNAEHLISKLKSMPLEYSIQKSGIEYIPYEELWELALQSLDNKIIQLR
ncbi:MAG: hypothetical protein GYB31_13645 [Bacteroidetes bacterium]|nr:hypothetical protein [Bacteroidota bacterium]